MGLNKLRLGELLVLVNRTNSAGEYGIDDVRGVNNSKLMIHTKADVSQRDFSKFQIVMPGEFFFNHRTSRNGSKLSITYNYDDEPHIVTEDYVLFAVADENQLCSEWLYMFVNRPEYDRYAIQNSWGSSTEFFNWQDLCDTEMDLPPIEVQRKYAALYQAMSANQRAYELGLDDLKLACGALIEKLMQETPHKAIGQFIEQVEVRNDGSYGKSDVRGLSVSKQLIETKANLDGVNLTSYKTIQQNCLAYLADTSRRGDKISVAINESPRTFITSAVNTVFKVRDEAENALLPGYLMLFFNRPEFDRYARFNSWGSARETFDWDEMCNVRIPIPDIETQRYASALYGVWRTRQRINEQLKERLKGICPILVKGSIEEARG